MDQFGFSSTFRKPTETAWRMKILKSITILYKIEEILDLQFLFCISYSLILTLHTVWKCLRWCLTKTNTNCIFGGQKRDIIIYYCSICSIDFITRLNLRPLLIRFFFWNVCIWLSSNCETLPDCRGSYSQRDKAKWMERKWERTNVNSRCVSVCGVKLWDECDNELKKVNWRSNNKKIWKKWKTCYYSLLNNYFLIRSLENLCSVLLINVNYYYIFIYF